MIADADRGAQGGEQDWDTTSNGEVLENRPHFTWRCDKCGSEFDHFTYGGPCPGARAQGCDGELKRRKLR